ncbi:MAG: helix-turn-helix domain-containing protein [Dermatophilaceae bacterium]
MEAVVMSREAESGAGVLERARRGAGLTQTELAERAKTSRTAVSAYEHGRKSPSLSTLERLLGALGYEIQARPRPSFATVSGRGGREYVVPDRLPDLPVEEALGTVEVPLHLDWSAPGRVVSLADRTQRARFYEMVLREGAVADVERYVDGVLLVDLWPDLVLPAALRRAWGPLVAPYLVTA